MEKKCCCVSPFSLHVYTCLFIRVYCTPFSQQIHPIMIIIIVIQMRIKRRSVLQPFINAALINYKQVCMHALCWEQINLSM